ncbi:DUF6453 family protein [Cronobacter sakazakii]|uniref:DUF6453 family protein n=1 Tax=Cronobacter sakazakii TaxID=28141 RepID=UPI0009BA842F|nr:DUF6453 family protein [Cronobacter sakazakii]PUY11028.1 hypothetical protein BTK72_22660 [Cronobacter sakazakii]
MPSGLLIDLNDGGPVMEITAGLRCPSWCGTVGGSGNIYNAPGYVAGAALVYAPYETARIYDGGTSLVPTVGCLSGATQNGGSMIISSWYSVKGYNDILWPGTMWQIMPASQSGHTGLFISDSTDFTTITNGSIVGQCAWRGRVTFTGSWTPPDTGFARGTYLIFGKWSADGVTVEYDGTRVIATLERNGANVNATVTMDIVIFAVGAAPVAGPGLNFFNAAGQCTFSTTRRPFLYSNAYFRASKTSTDIGNRFIMLGRYGAKSDIQGGWCYAKYCGIVRSGNAVRIGRGYVATFWTSDYPVTFDIVSSTNILLLESMY